jgi:hypothetical protein
MRQTRLGVQGVYGEALGALRDSKKSIRGGGARPVTAFFSSFSTSRLVSLVASCRG